VIFFIKRISAAISAFVAINEFSPDLVINAGTAGGFKRCGGNIGDSYIGTHFKHHDRRIPIPGFIEYGVGNHKAFSCKNLIDALNFKSGVVSTANSLDHTPKVQFSKQTCHLSSYCQIRILKSW
jgi:5'-methylthioadenosine nucleosidase